MKDDEKELAKLLLELDQGHLFQYWAEGADEDKKHAFFEHVSLYLGSSCLCDAGSSEFASPCVICA